MRFLDYLSCTMNSHSQEDECLCDTSSLLEGVGWWSHLPGRGDVTYTLYSRSQPDCIIGPYERTQTNNNKTR